MKGEISGVLLNVRNVQEYTWHTVSGGYLYAENRHWHSARRHWYPKSCCEGEPMQISESKESDTLLLAVVSHRENVAAVHGAVKKGTKGLLAMPSLWVCVCVCVHAHKDTRVFFPVCACVFQPRELKSRTNPKLPDSTRPYPMWTLRMRGQLVEERERREGKGWRRGGGIGSITRKKPTTLWRRGITHDFGKELVSKIRWHRTCVYLFMCVAFADHAGRVWRVYERARTQRARAGRQYMYVRVCINRCNPSPTFLQALFC